MQTIEFWAHYRYIYATITLLAVADARKHTPVHNGDHLAVKIRSHRLTTCAVAPDGGNVGLEFIDGGGATVTVELPFDQAEAVVMTLPHLLADALRRQTGDDAARYVFGLQEWSLETAKERACLIGTLKTADGFEVSFSMPFDACRSLACSLQHAIDQAIETSDFNGEPIAAVPARMN